MRGGGLVPCEICGYYDGHYEFCPNDGLDPDAHIRASAELVAVHAEERIQRQAQELASEAEALANGELS